LAAGRLTHFEPLASDWHLHEGEIFSRQPYSVGQNLDANGLERIIASLLLHWTLLQLCIHLQGCSLVLAAAEHCVNLSEEETSFQHTYVSKGEKTLSSIFCHAVALRA